MMKFLIQYGVCALAVALMVPLAQAQSQPAGLQAAFAKDAGTLLLRPVDDRRNSHRSNLQTPSHTIMKHGEFFMKRALIIILLLAGCPVCALSRSRRQRSFYLGK
jgi:hypothetical protein